MTREITQPDPYLYGSHDEWLEAQRTAERNLQKIARRNAGLKGARE